MFSDLAGRAVHTNAYSDYPLTFLDQAAQIDLANINAINLIENGSRQARERWQNKHLTNLLKHAQSNSKFWRQRMPSRMINHGILKYIPRIRKSRGCCNPVQARWFASGGRWQNCSFKLCIDGINRHAVEGLYLSKKLGFCNTIRSLAQYFIYDLSLEENCVHIVPAASLAKLENQSSPAVLTNSWAGSLGAVFRSGSGEEIVHKYNDDALIKELLKDRVGYLVCPNRYLDILMNNGGVDLIKKLGVKLWLHNSDYRDSEIVEALKGIGVPCLSNYSAGEIGPIAHECSKNPGYFHIAHTNVIVECDNDITVSFNRALIGPSVGHSFALLCNSDHSLRHR